MPKLIIATVALGILTAAGCSSDDSELTSSTDEVSQTSPVNSPGIRLVSVDDGAEIQANPPEGLVILDVRTAEEFAEGHLEGAVMVDFYQADFAEQLAELDPDVPYLLYCRSGNRSGKTAAIMDGLGFSDVADIDGGILSWADAQLPVVNQ